MGATGPSLVPGTHVPVPVSLSDTGEATSQYPSLYLTPGIGVDENTLNLLQGLLGLFRPIALGIATATTTPSGNMDPSGINLENQTGSKGEVLGSNQVDDAARPAREKKGRPQGQLTALSVEFDAEGVEEEEDRQDIIPTNIRHVVYDDRNKGRVASGKRKSMSELHSRACHDLTL